MMLDNTGWKKVNWADVEEQAGKRMSNTISEKEFTKWLDSNVRVSNYIGILEKGYNAQSFKNKFDEELSSYNETAYKTDIAIVHIQYKVNMMFNVLFIYTNIEVDDKDKTSFNYDLCIKSGLNKYILAKCGKDYAELSKMCDRMTGINELALIITITEAFSTPMSLDDAEKIRNTINQIDTDKLNIIKVLEEYDNPSIKRASKLLNGITDERLNNILEENHE